MFAASGTTDNECAVTDSPSPSEDEIQFILNEVRRYLNPDINGEIMSNVSIVLFLFTLKGKLLGSAVVISLNFNM